MSQVAAVVRFETVAYLTGGREIMAVMADDDLDSLYRVPPEEFTARRAELVKAAKQRGDGAAAKQIGAARRPTAAAWIVNRLVLEDQEARQRLADLGDRLRAAHAAMDGDRIRELSAEQHRLVGGLVRAALNAAEVKNPSSAVRDDISGTLQAAIADPDVRQRLGRLSKAERWSGFGDFGDAAPVSTPSRTKQPAAQIKPPPSPPKKKIKKDAQREKAAEAARREREKLEAAVAEAENTKAQADDAQSEWQGERDAARRRRDEALDVLRDAEADLRTAENRYERAQQASRRAAQAVRDAQAKLKRA